MARLCVHEDEQRVRLLGAAAHDILQCGDVFEGVEGHHPVVVVPGQQEHGGILDPVTLRDVDVVERGVPGGGERRDRDNNCEVLLIKLAVSFKILSPISFKGQVLCKILFASVF